ncbi:SRPBCC family protein [Pendulispora rubella]|uniref:SRPBCC family protein n=1 Tax=Pendulispora rubella TaxID=2741070 RepID=A0ABZ2KTK4_9BACT
MSKTIFIAEPGKQEISMARTFDAPRARVFAAYINPEAVPRWWGPRSLTTVVDKLEAKKGGIWRFVQRDGAGHEFAFNGVYHEALSPERLVYTFEFEGMPGHVLLETVLFEEIEGKTRITSKSIFQSLEARDGMMQSGAEAGAVETWDRLAELLS